MMCITCVAHDGPVKVLESSIGKGGTTNATIFFEDHHSQHVPTQVTSHVYLNIRVNLILYTGTFTKLKLLEILFYMALFYNEIFPNYCTHYNMFKLEVSKSEGT